MARPCVQLSNVHAVALTSKITSSLDAAKHREIPEILKLIVTLFISINSSLQVSGEI
jgi:hypothetical protein